MCNMKRCCCCMDLRQGTLLSFGYTLGTSLLTLIVTTIALVKFLNSDTYDEEADRVDMILLVVKLCLYALWLCSTILGYTGLRLDIRGLLIPWIFMTCLMTLVAIYNLVNVLLDIEKATSTFRGIVDLVIACVLLVCNGYAIVCVCVFFRNRLRTNEMRR